jgi:hypothetical protein
MNSEEKAEEFWQKEVQKRVKRQQINKQYID